MRDQWQGRAKLHTPDIPITYAYIGGGVVSSVLHDLPDPGQKPFFEVKNTVHIKNNGDRYALQSFHFHQPSEHRLDGEQLPLECHFVFADDKGDVLVVAQLYRFASSSSSLVKNLLKSKPVDIPSVPAYWSYPGSLTTLPHGNSVQWIVSNCIKRISKKDLKEMLGNTFIYQIPPRAVQQRNGRDIVYAS
jgi:carbonic anhydrase